MLIMIKNAGAAGHESVLIPHSNLKEAIAGCLAKAGYIESVSKKTLAGEKAVLDVKLISGGKNGPRISQVVRVSKPSKRVYIKAKDIKPVRQGFGALVLSTPKGIMLADEARRELVGGEALFRIW